MGPPASHLDHGRDVLNLAFDGVRRGVAAGAAAAAVVVVGGEAAAGQFGGQAGIGAAVDRAPGDQDDWRAVAEAVGEDARAVAGGDRWHRVLLVGPLVGGRAQEDRSRRVILDIAGSYQIKLGSRRAARVPR